MWNASSFGAALAAAAVAANASYGPTTIEEAGRTMFSPSNTLLTFAVADEPTAYAASIANGTGASGPAAPIFGFNGRCYQEKMPHVLRRGCCRCFGFANCSVDERTDATHIMTAAPYYGGGPTPFPEPEMRQYVQVNARCGKYRLALSGLCWQQHIRVQYLCVVINASTQSLNTIVVSIVRIE